MRLGHLAGSFVTVGLLLFLLHLLGGSTYKKQAPRAVTKCITDLYDYESIDKMFDEIILEPRTIIYWTPFYGAHDYGFGLGQAQTFIDHKCDVVNCVISSNKSAAATAEAVVFHLIDHLKAPKLPPTRNANQRYVFFFMEPPQKINNAVMNSFKQYNNFFNLTMTYKTDSSVYNPANTFVRRKVEAPKELQRAVDALRKKTKMVAWFSACDESAMSKAYVEELKKHITVDTYGPCGTLKCGLAQSATCWDMVEKDYRFYLSLEAFMCQDYITERSYRALQYNVLPIIYSGGNYSRSTPPNSVIDIFDYPSPKSLAEYLHKLVKHEGAYLWHMEWKKSWEHRGWGHGFCELCKIINNPKYPVSTIRDLPAFLSPDQCGKDYLQHFKQHWAV